MGEGSGCFGTSAVEDRRERSCLSLAHGICQRPGYSLTIFPCILSQSDKYLVSNLLIDFPQYENSGTCTLVRVFVVTSDLFLGIVFSPADISVIGTCFVRI